MIITYLKSNEQIISITKGFPIVAEVNNQLLMEGASSPIINDLGRFGWGVYKDEIIPRQYMENDIELPIYLSALSLQSPTVDDLPLSEHIGKLISVNPTQAKPAVVRRRFYGENYDVNCLVTQSVKDMFQAGDIQVGDYVLVSFIEEMPNETEKNIAIVTAKIYKSW